MKVTKEKKGDELTVKVSGSVNATTVSMFSDALSNELSGVKTLNFDFEELEYISSAGLRVILTAYKTLKKNNGKIVLHKLNDEVWEIFHVTGLLEFFDVEKDD